jgi:hypothetical protein
MAQRDDKWGDVWNAVGVVVVVGLVATGFILVGTWLARRREQQDGIAFAGLGELPENLGTPMTSPHKPLLPLRNTGYRLFMVQQSAKKIVSPIAHQQLRRIWVTADAPIRVMDSATVDSSFAGTLIGAGRREDMGVFGPDQQLFAVQAGSVGAKVSVETQFIGEV